MPLVSVIVTTYNHEPYLADALDAILSQRCDFGVEIVLGEDCSSDGTLAVCREPRPKMWVGARTIAVAWRLRGVNISPFVTVTTIGVTWSVCPSKWLLWRLIRMWDYATPLPNDATKRVDWWATSR